MERIAILFAFGLIYLTPASKGTSHHGWTEVENFTCNRTAFEMVMRTAASGSMQSPCFNDSSGIYLEELSGTKLINITHDSPFVAGYRLTFRVFDLGEPDRLYVGDGTRTDGRNVIGIRLLTIRNGDTNDIVQVRQLDDGTLLQTLNLTESNTYLLENYKTVIMDFLTSNDERPGKQGFLIDYEADIDKCLMTGDDVYCKNNGVCTKSGFNIANCNCSGTGYEDTRCDVDIDECNERMDDCHSNATCLNNNGSFICTCEPGYTGDGRTCTNIDECTVETDACKGTGNCSDTDGGFDCTCFSGYTNGTGGPCANIDECSASDNKCDTNADCTDGIGSYTCTCKTGYTGDGENCTDINECDRGTDNCHDTRATCTNNNGSFVCNCKTGYSGDGVTCEDINECNTDADDCHSNATCTNDVGSWTCACKNGFSGNGTHCVDINECAAGTDNCHTNANCGNNVGSFDCTCKDGYSGNGQECSNINECTEGTNTCHEKAECTDNDGSYTCACKAGFTGNGNTCTDIDECTEDTDDCSDNANCTNTEGSYTCECKTGYSGNGKTCENIDECSADPAPCGMNTDCTDNNGSFVCTCKTGFTGDANVNCTDIDECATSSPCDLDETSCQNTVGSYVCVCSFPTFRGNTSNCDYYCDHNSSCLQNRNGYIDVPTGWDGIKKYSTFDETFYNFSDTATATVHGGIRFTFLRFNTEVKDDILSIYPAGFLQVPSKEIVGLSGSKENMYNKEQSITGVTMEIGNTDSGVTAFFNRSGGTDPTLTLSTSFLNIAFTSDRENASTGFWIAFEYDKDDCENVMSCVNATGCIDGIFAYQCNCTSGFEGVDCDLDIDECNLQSPPCDANATCNNTVGSYLCTCNEYYFGDGKSCKPHVILSEYSVTRTTTSLTVTFDITAPWRTTEFFKYFRIELEGDGETKVYENVTLSELMGDGYLISGLNPYTPYNITVTVQEGGPLFNSAEFVNNLGTKRFYTAEQAAGVPKNLAVGSGTRDRVTITWEKPDIIGYGIVTSYELCYQPSSDSITQEIATLRNIPTTPTCFIIDDTYTSYTWVGLPSYMNLSFMIRANSIVGAGNFTNIQMDYTGSSCPEWTSFAARAPCPLMQGLLESDGFPRDTTSSEDLVIEQQWSHDLTSYNGWRPNFIYFNTFPVESNLDAGYGDIDVTDHDIEKASSLYSYTGSRSSGPDPEVGFPKNSSISDQNTLWFAFISDRFRKRSGFQVEIELDGDNCISTPCLNGGTCSDALYGYTCACTSEWTGDNCQTPRVEPVVTCTPDKRMVDVSFTIPANRGIDETIIGGYTIDVGTGASQVENAIGETSASFSGLVPYTEYTINVTVKESNRTVVLVPGTTKCTTLEDVPTAPQNVMVNSGNEYLNVTWDAPAQPNGVVTYMVTATQTDHGNYGETADVKTSGELTATSYQIKNLRVYRTYSVVVQARTSAGSINADAVSKVTNPGPPLDITGKVTVLTSTSARIEWTIGPGSYPGPTTISITATSDSHNPETVTLTADTASPYNFEQLEEGFNYTVTVTASTGVSPDTSFTQANINTNETAPGKPETFTYDDETSTFAWKAPTVLEQNGEITGYVLKSDDTVPGFNSPKEFDAATFSHQLLGLPPYTEYTFTLQAINSVGQGAIFSLPIVTKEDVPNPVSNITEDEIGARQVKLSWKAQDPPVGNVIYEVFYSDGTTTSATQSTAITTYTFTGLTPFTEYTFSIVATTNAGKATAVTRTITTAEDVPSAVQNLDATYNVDPLYSISVTWEAPAIPNGIITGYIVSLSPGESVVVLATKRQHVFEKVVGSNTTYTITVTASTSVGAGPIVTDSVTTPVIVPKEPTSLAVPETGITATTATITGTPPSNTGDGFVVVTRYIVTLNGDPDDCDSKGDTSCRSNDKSNTFTSFPYTITGLMAYRKYIITVAAESEGGVGAESTTVEFTTLPGEPGTPTIQVVPVPDGFDVIFTPSRPYTGPANYTATATPSEGDPITNTVGPIDSIGPITVELRNLPGDAQYAITGQASNDQGTSTETNSETVQSTPVAPQVSLAATAEGEITVTMPERTDVNYTVTYVKVGCDGCTPVTTAISGNMQVLSGLDPYSNYSITVFATSQAGVGESRTEYQLSQAGTPRLVNPDAVLVISNDTSGIDTAVSVKVENLCINKGSLFIETEGPITQVAYFVIQKGSEQFINVSFNVFYGDVFDETQKRVYRTITVSCNGARRKKRQAANEVVIGNEDCSASQEGECNGRLTPSTTYRTQACAMNQDNRYVCVNPSPEFTTSSRPSGGLTGGEIAAIVICSILLLVLIVLIVVYCCKKRNQSGKAKISKKGSNNPSFDDKGASRYQVNPAAEPRTEYTDQPVA